MTAFNFLLFVFSLARFPPKSEAHHNDLHAKFEETNANYRPCTDEDVKQNKCYGGIARIQTAIKKARQDVKDTEIPTVVLNAGDFFTGTSYYTLKKWELVVPMVNALEYDVITIGNHDFDDGIDNLIKFINNVNVPVVCCNLNLTKEKRLGESKLKPSYIKEIKGTKVGFIGSVTPWTMEFSQTEELEIYDEIPYVQAEARRLIKDENVKIIIALSHSGFKEDVIMAKEVPELSMIVSSHTCTLLYTPTSDGKPQPDKEEVQGEYPYIVDSKNGRRIPIVHSHAYGTYLGRLLITFDENGEYVEASGNNILLDSSIEPDEEIRALVEHWIAPLRAEVKAPIAFTRVPLQLADFSKGQFESTYANLVTDVLVDYGVERAHIRGLKKWTTAPIALINTGGFHRECGYGGSISMDDLIESLKIGNMMFEATYPGRVLKEALEFSMASAELNNFAKYLYFSGLRVVYDLSKQDGERIESIEALCAECIYPRYEKLKMDEDYTVILPRYLFKSGLGLTMLETKSKSFVNLKGIQVRGIFERYLRKVQVVYPIHDDRVTVKNWSPTALMAKHR